MEKEKKEEKNSALKLVAGMLWIVVILPAIRVITILVNAYHNGTLRGFNDPLELYGKEAVDTVLETFWAFGRFFFYIWVILLIVTFIITLRALAKPDNTQSTALAGRRAAT